MDNSVTFALTVGVFLAFMPDSLKGESTDADVLDSQIMASILSVSLGLGISLVSSDWKPLVSAGFASAIMFTATTLAHGVPNQGVTNAN